MNASRLAEIQERLELATPQPWTAKSAWNEHHPRFWVVCDPHDLAIARLDESEHEQEDAAFIAHAPADIRALLEEVQHLRDGLGEIVALEDGLRPPADDHEAWGRLVGWQDAARIALRLFASPSEEGATR